MSSPKKRYYAGKVQKLSGWGWVYHERLLKVYGNVLSYYRKVPKSFSESNIIVPADLKPKTEIYLDNAIIENISIEETKANTKLELSKSFKVIFESTAILGNKPPKNPTKQTWYFTLPTKEERDKWVMVLNHGKNEEIQKPLYEEEKEQQISAPVIIESKAENVRNENKPVELEAPRPTTQAAPSISPRVGSRRTDMDADPDDKWIEDIEEIHKYQQYLIEKKQKREARAWDLKFQKYWGSIVNADKNFDDSIKYSELLIDHVGKFRRTAEFYTKLIVNELHLPKTSRTFKPWNKIDRVVKLFCDDDHNPEVYVINNMLFKFTTKDVEVKRTLGTETFIENKWKCYGREFLSMDIMFDALFILSKPKSDYNLRVPLCCLVDYKGYRALIYGIIPLNESLEPILGLSEDGIYHEANIHGVARQMPFIAEVLNLKDHNFLFKKAAQPVHVAMSPLIEVHRRDLTKSNSDDEGEGGELFSERIKEMNFHVPELDYDEEVYYLLKTSEIFPADYSLQDRKPYDLYLRPEFVCTFEKALRTDVQKRRIRLLSQVVDYESSDDGQLEIGEAKQHLLSGVIPKVVDQLDSLSVIPIDSATLTQVFHSEGLNMRYLGVVAEQSALYHVKELCIIEMLARTLKNIIHEQLAYKLKQFALKPIEEGELSENKEIYKARVSKCKRYKNIDENYAMITSMEKEYHDELLKDPMHGYLFENLYDFLNMVFGQDPDTDEFWEKILFPRAALAFSYPVEKFTKSKVNLNALFFSFVHHFGLELDPTATFELGTGEKPFTNQITDLNGVSKVYGFRNIPYRVLAERYKEYRNNGKNELAVKALKMKMVITRLLDNKVDVTALAEIAEILLEEKVVDKAIEKTLEGINLIHPLHAETIKFFCILVRAFYEKGMHTEADKQCYKAIKTLDFHWGPYHPLHSTVYSILAYLLIKYKDNLEQAQSLYKASLISCTRVLGPNHLRTAEVYMDFGRLYLKMNNKEQALANIEKAYSIYDACTEGSVEKYYVPLANAALQLATIMEDQRRFKEAFPHSRRAADIYLSLYGAANEVYITSLWLVICIAYSIAPDETTQEYCKKLFEAVEARDKVKERDTEMDSRIEKIKENCVAASILVGTRSLSKEDKCKLLKLAEEIYVEWQQELGEMEQQETAFEMVAGTQNDTSRVVTLSSIDFDTKSRQFLSQFYEEAKSEGVAVYYRSLVSSLCKLYAKAIETSTAKENEGYTQVLNERSDEYYFIATNVNSKETYKNILKAFEKKNFYYLLIS